MQLVPIEKLVPYINNARVHSPEQVNKLRASLREFGFVNPCIIDKNFGVIAGHGRLMAAQAEGISEIPCVLVDYLTDAQKKAYILADNRLALDATWDEELLRLEIESLKDMDFDATFTGFDDLEINNIFNDGAADVTDDDFNIDAELGKPDIAQAGDIWTLGEHKIICGDSTKAETYRRLLGDTKVDLACIDPPYFVNLEVVAGNITNDDLNDADGYKFLKSAFECVRDAMAIDASIYVFYSSSKGRIFYDAYEDAGFKVGAGLVWKKDVMVLTRTDWKYIHEPLIFGWRKDGKHNWHGDQKQTTVFEFDRIKRSCEDGFGHPSCKPVPLIAYLIKQSSKANDSVLDAFLGSGSTLIACEKLRRRCFGIEIEPKFIDVAAARYAEAVGGGENIFIERAGKKFPYKDIQRARRN